MTPHGRESHDGQNRSVIDLAWHKFPEQGHSKAPETRNTWHLLKEGLVHSSFSKNLLIHHKTLTELQKIQKGKPLKA